MAITRAQLMRRIERKEAEIEKHREEFLEGARDWVDRLQKEWVEERERHPARFSDLDPYFRGELPLEELVRARECYVYALLAHDQGFNGLAAHGLGAAYLYAGDVERANASFRSSCKSAIEALVRYRSIRPDRRTRATGGPIAGVAREAVDTAILSKSRDLGERLEELLIEGGPKWRQYCMEEGSWKSDFYYLSFAVPLAVFTQRRDASELVKALIPLVPEARKRMGGVYKGEALAFQAILQGDGRAFAKHLREYLSAASRSVYTRDSGVPLSSEGTVLVALAQAYGLPRDWADELSKGQLKLIPTSWGGTGEPWEPPRLDPEDLGPHDVLVKPLNTYEGSTAPYFGAFYFHEGRRSWEMQQSHAGDLFHDGKVAMVERFDLGSSERTGEYGAVVRLKKRGHYCFVGGELQGGLYALIVRKDREGVVQVARIEQEGEISDDRFLLTVLEGKPPDLEERANFWISGGPIQPRPYWMRKMHGE